MGPEETASYVDRVQRRRRAVRLVSLAAGIAVAASILMLAWAMRGGDFDCRYFISRENLAVPDLIGLRLDEARAKVPSCVAIEPTDAALGDDASARIVAQDPEPPDVLNSRRTILVVLDGGD